MRVILATTCILTGALLAGGCATKKYVRNTTAPIQAKVDQVGDQTTRNGQQIEETRNQVKSVDEKAQNGISAAQERASAADQHAGVADQHAGEAMNRANQANQLGEQNTQALNSLKTAVSNLDDFKLQSTVAVPFLLAGGLDVVARLSRAHAGRPGYDLVSRGRQLRRIACLTPTGGFPRQGD